GALPKIDDLEILMEKQDMPGLQHFVTNDLYPATDPVDSSIDALSDYQAQEVQHLREDGSNLFNVLTWVIVGVAVLVTLIAVGVVVVVTNGIKKNLSSAIGLANAVATGDVTATATVTSKDELKDLVDALNVMTSNLRSSASVAEQIAGGDLT